MVFIKVEKLSERGSRIKFGTGLGGLMDLDESPVGAIY